MLEQVSVVAELEALGIDFKFGSSNTLKTTCPFHDDKSPSLVFWLDSSKFKCMSCDHTGDVADFLAKTAQRPRREIILHLNKKYNLVAPNAQVSNEIVETAHNKLWDVPAMLDELYKRKITDDLIRKYRLGFYQKRISIPVKDDGGNVWVNIRRYLPGAPGADKMKNMRGKGGKLRIYPHGQLDFERIIICGGELKALAAIPELNSLGIGAIAVTGGEGEWDPSFNPLLANKIIYVCFDVDAKGERATKKICQLLYTVAKEIYAIRLPLDIEAYPTGDINDWLALGKTMAEVVHTAELFDPRLRIKDWTVGSYRPRSIAQAVEARAVGERSEVECLITGVQESKHTVPINFTVDCLQDDKACGTCPVAVMKKDTFNIAPENPTLISMIGAPDHVLEQSCAKAIQIPHTCKKHSIHINERASLQTCIVSPPLTLTATDQSNQMVQRVVSMTEDLDANGSYKLLCRAQPDPDTQETVLLASEATPSLSTLSTFEFATQPECEVTFQPTEWTEEAVWKKLEEIYLDFEVNITGIRERMPLHMAIDLTYHSVLNLNFGGQTHRGWLESLILGDSSQGKSEATQRLQQHYSLGHWVSAKNASTAGLIGGLTQHGSLWVVSWGALPMHDQRLVILEELKGASQEVIASLTDTRSSGIASIDKIKSGRRMSRVRLVCLSNPRSERPMNTYAFGVDAIKELCGAPEDVRRFDYALIVARDDLSSDVIHQVENRKVTHTHTSALCHDLIMWCWTRKLDQVIISDETTQEIMRQSKTLCAKYSEQIPLVDTGSMRLKLARMATALAGRTFSHEDGNLVVRPCHAKVVATFLDQTYSHPNMRYDTFSEAEEVKEKVSNPAQVKAVLDEVPYCAQFVTKLKSASVMGDLELTSCTGYDYEDSRRLLHSLVGLSLLLPRGKNYYLSPGFRKFLETYTPTKVPTYVDDSI